MEIRQFRRKYDLELIPAATESIMLGTLVWDPLIGAPKFNHPGMPDHIYTAFRTSGLFDDNELVNYIEKIKSTDFINANFAERIIDVDVDFAATLEEPKIGKIESSFGSDKVKKFTFGDLKAKVLSPLERVHIDENLDLLKKNNWDDYDGKVRRVFMITELYYGSLKIVIDNDVKADFEASIQHTDLELSAGLDYGRSSEYSFSHNNVPFAMRIERVKKFSA